MYSLEKDEPEHQMMRKMLRKRTEIKSPSWFEEPRCTTVATELATKAPHITCAQQNVSL